MLFTWYCWMCLTQHMPGGVRGMNIRSSTVVGLSLVVLLGFTRCVESGVSSLRSTTTTSRSNEGRRSQFVPSAKDALVSVYLDTGGPQWHHQNGWLSSLSVCTWQGVQCDSTGTNVITLDLQYNNLVGTFPHALNLIPTLQRISLPGNFLAGSFTPVATMTDLAYLDVSYNFMGDLPFDVHLPSLIYLDVSHNGVVGTLPQWIPNMPNIVYANFSNNKLYGTIPDTIGGLSYLRELDLSYNALTGVIPDSMGNLLWLWKLYLQSNQLMGTIPYSLGALVHLEDLVLSSNQLSGTIPVSMEAMVSLALVDLSSNQLSGTIPPVFGSLAFLQEIDLDFNRLHGTLPDNVWYLPVLEQLSVRSNRISGTIPQEASNLVELRELLLSNNSMEGAIPQSLVLCQHLQELSLEGNCFNVTPPVIAAKCGLTSNTSVVHITCNLQHSRSCTNFGGSGGLPTPVVIALAVCLTVGFSGLGCALFVYRERIADNWCPKPIIMTYLNESDAVEYEASRRAYELSGAASHAELRVHNPISSSPFSRLSRSKRGKVTPKFPPTVEIPTLRLDEIPMTTTIRTSGTPSQAPSPTATTRMSDVRLVTSPTNRQTASNPATSRIGAGDTGLPQLQLTVHSSPNTNRPVRSRPNSATPTATTPTPGKQLSRTPAGSRPTTPHTTRSKTGHLPIPKPNFVDSEFVPDMPASSPLPTVAGAYLSADTFRDIANATTEKQLLDAFTRIYLMVNEGVVVPRTLFKQTCGKQRKNRPDVWTGRVLQAYHDCLKLVT